MIFAALAVMASMQVPAGAGPVGKYIVVLEDGFDPSAVAAEHSRSEGARVSFVYEVALRGYAAEMSAQAAARLAADPKVDYIEEDLPVQTFAQTLPTGVNRVDGELNTLAKIDGIDERVNVDIAILDTGIDLDHPDLNVVSNTKCSGGGPMNKTCTDGGGDDDNGHGSHVAGISAALDNGIGVVGVAPGARLHAVKVLDSRGSGYTSWIIAGIDWVTARASTIEVANMSLGGSGYTASYHTAVKNSVAAGVVYTVAAGNEKKDVYGADLKFGTSDDVQPAAYPEVATISALADTDGVPGGLKDVSTAFSVCTENKDDSFACF
ncbi:MAG: S8 family serine peptidase, partial [Actinobacteria bacterium]|nr:S8 family serine peptidase [Actinomycetota bacterium]